MKLVEGKNSRKCTHCKELKRFSDFHKDRTKECGVRSRCKECISERNRVKPEDRKTRKWDGETVIAEINRVDNVESVSGGAHRWLVRNNKLHWLDPIRKVTQWNLEKVKIEALKYSGRWAFKKGCEGAYKWAAANGYLDEVCAHMPDQIFAGFTRSGFIEHCENKLEDGISDGLATLYLIICWNDDELFYKIGITSRTVKERYPSKEKMPYNYKIIWQIRDHPEKIWDWEKQSIRDTKDKRYQPELWSGGSRETFTV